MEKVILKAAKRTITGRKVKQLRAKGLIPANIYGKKVKSEAISVNEKEFAALFAKVGETGLIELHVDSASHPVLVHLVQYHPVSGNPIHIDFFQVDLKEKVTTKVPVVFIGESPSVKDKIGVLLTLLSEVEVEALPQDLPEHLEADVASLKEIGQTLCVASLIVPSKVKIVTPSDHELVKVAPLVSKEAEKMAAETAAAAAAAAEAAAAPSAEGVPPASGGVPAAQKAPSESGSPEKK